ncbi:MAG: serine/threonine protein kinase, partial [Candidatus Latescibacteria bacterium]|nr:serine/threonine protein kinase [Candidatus Latescibacterota bacterium]
MLLHYRILRLLGQGGMGEVYLAEDTRLKRQVALKVLPEALRRDPARLRRFRTEAEAAAQLNHPNIAHLYSIDEADGLLFITMEYVDGQPLAQLIPPTGLPLAQFFAWFLPLSDALAHAHEHGITHRDLKP